MSNAFGEHISKVVADIAETGSTEIGGQAMDGPQALEKIGQQWQLLNVNLVRGRALGWVIRLS